MTWYSKFTLLPETGLYSFYMGVHSRIRHLHCTLYSQYLIVTLVIIYLTHVPREFDLLQFRSAPPCIANFSQISTHCHLIKMNPLPYKGMIRGRTKGSGAALILTIEDWYLACETYYNLAVKIRQRAFWDQIFPVLISPSAHRVRLRKKIPDLIQGDIILQYTAYALAKFI